MAEETRSRLGRGLAALISDIGEESTGIDRARGQQRRAAVDQLFPSPRNPRRRFAEADLDELVASVRERGVMQPILVRTDPQKRGYEIIAGERRWRAAQRAGVHDVPIVILEVTEREALEIAIVENVQRADLNALEEASGYEQLMGEFSYKQEELARVIGKSRSHIANTLRLLKLPEPVKEHVRMGELSAGHARALIGAPDPAALAAQVVDRGLSVRETEVLARDAAPGRIRSHPPGRLETKSADARALEKSLAEVTGLKVRISARGEAGELTISYSSLEQLDDVARRLRG